MSLATSLLLLASTGLAVSAVAGGPTSVLLVVPGEGRTAALYNGDPDYDSLIRFVGGYERPAGSTVPPDTADDLGASGTNDASGPGVTLTWLIHDVSVWRVDRVYLAADGGPLISTQMSAGGDIWSEDPVWHRAAEGKALAGLLDSLGVGATGDGANVADATDSATGTGVSPGQAASSSSGTTASDSDPGRRGPDGWIWGFMGALLGATSTFVATRRRAGPAHPNAEVDETSGDAGTPASMEALSSP